MGFAPFVDDDSLDPGLKAAFGPAEPSAEGDSVYEVLRACGAIQKCVMLREDPSEALERVLVEPVMAEMPKRYHVSGELARGGVGVVLKGHDIDLGREVALKTLRAEHAGNLSLTRRLVEEAQIGGQLQHPGILPIYELGLDSAKRPFFAMKLVRGRTLAELLKERRNPQEDQPRFLGIFEQLCHAMAYAHARGVIHRDLKPANIMVGRFGEVQIVDWGLAKVLPRTSSGDDTWDLAPRDSESPLTDPNAMAALSEAGSVLGTPAYMPPEQASGDIEHLDERSDVFGLGAILCEILTGKPPYEGARLEILEQARACRMEPALSRLQQSGGPVELLELTRICLKADRVERPRNAGEVAKIVQAHRDSVDKRAREAEIEAAQAKARVAGERRIRGLTMAIAAILVISAILGGGMLSLYQSQKRTVAETQANADRASLDLEREKLARLESTLEILVPLNGKARFIITQAAGVAESDLDRWLQLTSLLKDVVQRTAQNAPNDDTRQQAQRVIEELTESEIKLKERIAAQKNRNIDP
jgi:serine/threonine protein kinase